MTTYATAKALAVTTILLFGRAMGQPQSSAPAARSLKLEACHVANIEAEVKCGRLQVFENRAARRGRVLELNVIVLPARHSPPAPDPVVTLYGGPGQTVTENAAAEWNSWYRDERDVILLDQRGTGGNNTLDCELSGSDSDIQGYLEPIFQPERIRRCREKLERNADLRYYSTPIAMEDLDDLRVALGYDKINLVGASYGSRAALTYIERHPDHVRSAFLSSLNPFSSKNPLFHAKSAQIALDHLLETCDSQTECHSAFPHVREELETVLKRLQKSAVDVTVPNPKTRQPVEIHFGRPQFSEALRVISYTPESARRIPLAIHDAFLGHFELFGEQALASNIWLRSGLRFGMLMSVTCPEDVARITEKEIVTETKGTYLGDARVRQEMAACREWPQSELPKGFDKPVPTKIPALLISGYYDPATPPLFGEEVARDYLPNSIHLVIREAGHDASSKCTEDIGREFLRKGSITGLDTSCVSGLTLRPFLSKEESSAQTSR